jgi:ABC-type dipeptide/oligopeptide/nickel transport system permease subunit
MNQSESFGINVWRRLRKNKTAVLGLSIIAISLVVALFGYVIAPDNSPNADFQTIEIQAKKPGYEQIFLTIPLQNTERVSFFHQLFFGKPVQEKYIPVTRYRINGDELTINKFVDEDTSVAEQYSIKKITQNHPESIHGLFVRKKYYLGTDVLGRDILSRLIIGTRVSLAVGFIAVLISLLLGVFLGAIAGYYRGRIDAVVMWLVNVVWSIPTLLLVFAFTIAMGKGFWQIFIAVGLTMWVNVARLVRGQVMGIRELEYIKAAEVMGFSTIRIIVKHILPNIAGPLTVIAAGNFASAMIIEAGLSFLGIGIQPPQPSWGLMIKENYNFIITNNAAISLVPGIAIMLLVLSFNLLGNGLRDAMGEKV